MTMRRFSLTHPGPVAMLFLALTSTAGYAQQTATYVQNGVAHEVLIDDDHLLIVGDGTVSLTEQALGLATSGLTTSLVPFGGSTAGAVVSTSGLISTQLIQDIQKQPGVRSVHRVMRFRPDGEPVGITNKILAKLTASAVPQVEAQYGLKLDAETSTALGLPNVWVFELLDGEALEVAESLRSDPRLIDDFAHADLIAPTTTLQAAPADPLYRQQWHLNNTGQFGNEGNLADIDVLDAWEETLGEGIRVGMLDDGVDLEHEDLVANYLGFSQGIAGGDDAGNVGDTGFHGTCVMGLMAGAANSIGIRGVAPAARFTASNGISAGVAASQLATAYNYALSNEVDVHNNSWGYRIVGFIPDVIRESIENAAKTGRDGKGMVICFAAGNEARNLEAGDGMATLPEVIQVGASGYRDTVVSYSNYGETQDLMGPSRGDDGIGLVTTDISGDLGFNDGESFNDLTGEPEYTRRMGGTSGASPVVAGVAALVLATNPDLNRHQVRELLTHTSERVSPVDASYDESTGFSTKYGYGRVNAGQAVAAAKTSRSGNLAWPGVPQNISVDINEGENNLLANISWERSGMPPASTGGTVRSEENEVIIAYLVPGQEGPAELQWAPDDGEQYVPCDPNMFETCNIYDFGSPNMVIIFRGAGEEVARAGGIQAREITNLPIAGTDVESGQTFAIFSVNSQLRYSFGFVFDQNGEAINIGGDGGGGIVPPPDSGRPIDPNEIPDPEKGKNDPPSVTATADRTLCTAPCAVEFHGGAVTPNAIEDRGWSFGDGATSSEHSVTHTYQLPGTYNAVFFAMDDLEPSGRIATKLIQIEVMNDSGDGGAGQAGPRTARLVVQTPGPYTAPDALVRFSAETTGVGTSSNSAGVTYNWDFGDGNTGIGQTTENMYVNPGYYSVVVRVIEEFTSGQTVEVSASTIVQIGGTRDDDGQSEPGNDQNGTDSANNGCGATGLAMLSLAFAGLIAIRRRR